MFARQVKRFLSFRLSFAARELALSAVLRAAFDAQAVELAFQLWASTVKAKSGKIRCASWACTHCTSTDRLGRFSQSLLAQCQGSQKSLCHAHLRMSKVLLSIGASSGPRASVYTPPSENIQGSRGISPLCPAGRNTGLALSQVFHRHPCKAKTRRCHELQPSYRREYARLYQRCS